MKRNASGCAQCLISKLAFWIVSISILHIATIPLAGDRVLTDVVFANQYGMLSVLVAPLSLAKDHPIAVIIR